MYSGVLESRPNSKKRPLVVVSRGYDVPQRLATRADGRVTRNRRRWTNFTLEEQDKILAAKRSNNELDCSKLVNALPDLEIPEIHVAVDRCCARMKKNLDAQGWKPTPRGS